MSSLYENVSIGVLSIYGDLPYVQNRKIGAFYTFYLQSSFTAGACHTSTLSSDSNDIFFGNLTMKGVPHVFTTGGALHFSKQFGEVCLLSSFDLPCF